MIRDFVAPVLPALLILACPLLSWAQDTPADDDAATEAEAEEAAALEEVLGYDDYTVKAYSLTLFGGTFSGARILENMEIHENAVLAEGVADILGYDGRVLPESRLVNADGRPIYDAAHKDLESGTAVGARVGVFISDDFHLDISGYIATGQAKTTMLYKPDIDDRSLDHRVLLDQADYTTYKGGLGLVYEAESATIYGVVPRIGFGLGGIINQVGELPDASGLYVEGLFGLQYEVIKDLSLSAQAEITGFAYDVEEDPTSQIVSYTTFSVGLTWFIDVLPSEVRAAHIAEMRN